MDDSLVTVATFEYAHFAHLAKAKLESEGIISCINDEYTSTMNWFYTNAIGGIKLKVLSSDVDKALSILKENNLIDNLEDIKDEGTKIVDDSIICPFCKSKNITDEKYSKKWAYLSILFLGFPMLFRKKKYFCQNCKHTWNKEK